MVPLALSVTTSIFAGNGSVSFLVLGLIFVLRASPAFLFLKNKMVRFAKLIEYASALGGLECT